MHRYSLQVIIVLISLLAQNPVANAQHKFTISGYVKDEKTGESLLGANVYVKDLLKGTNTNTYGFYSLTLEEGNYTLVVSYLGFLEKTYPVKLDKDLRINISLSPLIIEGQEVIITGEKTNKNVENVGMSTDKLEMDQIKSLPAFMGEVDVLKTIQLLPGVQSAGEGNAGFYVRGGGPDQNLILLDEAVVYNASHLFGFFSVFNSDAIKDVTLTKGGMPAYYGGRLASVLDVTMKDGNSKEFVTEGGIGLISSRLTVQGPIKKDTCSFIVSGRRTYIDALMKSMIKKTSPFYGSGYYFYDLNTKINYRISDKDRLFLSGYFGRDVFSYKNKNAGFNVSIPWGNATTALRWNHLFSDKLFMNVSGIFSDYQFEFGATQQDFEFKLFSGIRDWNAKVDFSYFPTLRHNIKFGGNYIYHRFTPSNASARSGDVVFDMGKIIRLHAHDGALYVNDDYEVTDRFRLNGGLRYTAFAQVGPFDRFTKDYLGRMQDTVHYDKWSVVKLYQHIEPRLSARYTLSPASSLKASFTQNYQYIHLASVSSVSLPTDTWVPSTSVIQPQFGTQYAMGYFRNFKKDIFETSVEMYYKNMKNQIEYKDGALPEDNINDNVDNSFTFGKGYSYGAEFFVKKTKGKTSGWIGYTLSYTKRQFEDINRGNEFYAKYDRRHDVSLVFSYKITTRWELGSVFIYATGNALTLPVARYMINGDIVNEYGDRNSFRMKPYHRLDISATYHAKKRNRFESSWNFSIFNVYNRHNPYFIYFANEGSIQDGNLKIKAKQVSLFPILPSVTWNFKF